MRKNFTLKLLACLMLSWIGITASAQTVTFDGLNYEIDPESMTASCIGPVNRYLKTAEIAGSIEYAGQNYTVTSISNRAFYSCFSLTEVTIPDSVTSIGEWAFLWCSDMTKLIIPNSVISIGERAFGWCHSLTKVTIGNSVTSIGTSAFAYCYSLIEVTIPDSVTTIGVEAFAYCESLIEVTIPDSVTNIGVEAFAACISLTEINVSENNEFYASLDGVLYNKDLSILIQCPGAKTSVTIPDSVTSIGEWAFLLCESLTEIIIPDSVTSIGHGAFSSCKSLTEVIIPDSVTSIEELPFVNCTSLIEINVNENNDFYASLDGVLYNKDLSILIQCPGAKTSVKIPASVTSISSRALQCTLLTEVTCLALEPPVCGEEVFFLVPLSECVLKVPAQSVDLYKATEPWNEFIIVGIEIEEPDNPEIPEESIYVGGATAMEVMDSEGIIAIKINWDGKTLSLNETVDGLLTVESSNGNNPFVSYFKIEDNIYLVIIFAEPFGDEAKLNITIPQGYVTVGEEGVYNEFQQLSLITTGVELIGAEKEVGSIYNLQGVKMNVSNCSQLTAGMYIINGRKVVVK